MTRGQGAGLAGVGMGSAQPVAHSELMCKAVFVGCQRTVLGWRMWGMGFCHPFPNATRVLALAGASAPGREDW